LDKVKNIICPKHKIELRPIREDRIGLVESCWQCEREQMKREQNNGKGSNV